MWSLISTPLDGDRTTLCNGGIIAGRDGVVMIESFATRGGGLWMVRQARKLTGRLPSHVVLRWAFAAGIPAPEAAREFSLPQSLGEWHMFSPQYYEVALGAWERELKVRR